MSLPEDGWLSARGQKKKVTKAVQRQIPAIQRTVPRKKEKCKFTQLPQWEKRQCTLEKFFSKNNPTAMEVDKAAKKRKGISDSSRAMCDSQQELGERKDSNTPSAFKCNLGRCEMEYNVINLMLDIKEMENEDSITNDKSVKLEQDDEFYLNTKEIENKDSAANDMSVNSEQNDEFELNLDTEYYLTPENIKVDSENIMSVEKGAGCGNVDEYVDADVNFSLESQIISNVNNSKDDTAQAKVQVQHFIKEVTEENMDNVITPFTCQSVQEEEDLQESTQTDSNVEQLIEDNSKINQNTARNMTFCDLADDFTEHFVDKSRDKLFQIKKSSVTTLMTCQVEKSLDKILKPSQNYKSSQGFKMKPIRNLSSSKLSRSCKLLKHSQSETGISKENSCVIPSPCGSLEGQKEVPDHFVSSEAKKHVRINQEYSSNHILRNLNLNQWNTSTNSDILTNNRWTVCRKNYLDTCMGNCSIGPENVKKAKLCVQQFLQETEKELNESFPMNFTLNSEPYCDLAESKEW